MTRKEKPARTSRQAGASLIVLTKRRVSRGDRERNSGDRRLPPASTSISGVDRESHVDFALPCSAGQIPSMEEDQRRRDAWEARSSRRPSGGSPLGWRGSGEGDTPSGGGWRSEPRDRLVSTEMEDREIRFGSFSLGDVFNREIKRHGRFPFRGKQTSAETSHRFVDLFIRTPLEGQARVSPEVGAGKTQSNANCIWAERESGPRKPNFPFGSCIDDLFSHSWSDTRGTWLWVPRGAALTAVEKGLGFPAKREEIQRTRKDEFEDEEEEEDNNYSGNHGPEGGKTKGTTAVTSQDKGGYQGDANSNKKQKNCKINEIDNSHELPANGEGKVEATQSSSDAYLEGDQTAFQDDEDGEQINVHNEEDTLDEEMLDYEIDALSQERAEMERIDKQFEERTEQMYEFMNITPPEETVPDKEDNNNEKGFTTVRTKAKQPALVPQRKSPRNFSNNSGTVQGKAEDIKQKHNEISGNTSSFTVFNSIDPAQLARIASISNIDLGDADNKRKEGVSTLQAHEAAKAALFAAKQKAEALKSSNGANKHQLDLDKENVSAELDVEKEIYRGCCGHRVGPRTISSTD
ncbi:hypothetical protein C2845_PM15G04920 [Panicum miliaceum]|uniref:Uncharacterized protein n=1 Tax=Panicum miliaceum TaxID=4540 RepID=A0A3L6QC64_PANMI|nr:hypothetical protein C2845_PM15G04920 [Panicum miliaceum]